MERKIETFITNFIVETPNREKDGIHKCLVIKGLRQVGKTYSIRKCLSLSLSNLEEVVSHPSFFGPGDTTALQVNLTQDPSFLDVFKHGLDAASILKQLSLLPCFRSVNFSLSPTNRLILFIDEIGFSNEAITSLKFLACSPYLTVIASGSLLGLTLNSKTLFPLGYVEIKQMFPLDFEEFLWAKGYSASFIATMIETLKSGSSLPSSTHEELLNVYHQYALMGGLPENVMIGLKNSFSSILYQNEVTLRGGFEGDIAKYATKDLRVKALDTFKSIPSCLARMNTRFVFRSIKEGARGNEYRDSIDWLLEAGLIYKVHNLVSVASPLLSKEIPNEFKLYMADNGILTSFFSLDSLPASPQLSDSVFTQGMFMENGVACILKSIGGIVETPLYYYSRKSGLEIDFVIEEKGAPLLIEVKSSLNTKAKSLSTMMKELPEVKAIKVSPKNPGINGRLYSLPPYALYFLKLIVQ